MPIDYAAALQRVLERDYPDPLQRQRVRRQLTGYGSESWHRETPRVQLAILYLSADQPERLAYWVACADQDYRDVLCWAEYPLSSREGADGDPARHQVLRQQEQTQYRGWIEGEKPSGGKD